MPASSLYSLLPRLGLTITRSGRRSGVTQEQIQEIVVAYRHGASTQELGELYRVHDATIARFLRAEGIAVRPAGFRRGEEHHAWAGGRHVAEDGYVRVWLTDDDPMFAMAQAHSPHGGYCLEHRLVMAKALGRCLTEEETVHHKDGNRQNNSLSNLQLRQGKHGKGVVLQCAKCGSCDLVSVDIA